jgi:integrase
MLTTRTEEAMPRKRKVERSRGQIIPRGEKKWLVRIYMGRDAVGKRICPSETVKGTFKQAEQRLTQRLAELDQGTYTAPTKQTVAEFLTKWLDTIKSHVSPATLRGYSDNVKNHITPRMGGIRLDKLQPQTIQTAYADLETSGLSPRTVRGIHQVLHQALEQAVEWNMIYRNPTAYVNLPKMVRSEMQVFNPSQVALLLETTKDTADFPMWSLALNSGMRPQEYLVLKWDDFVDSKITVVRALKQNGTGGYYVADTKTKRGRRSFTLPSSTVAALEAHKKKQAGEILAAGPSCVRNGYIFANASGGHQDMSAVRRRWKTLLKRLKLPEIRLYDTRHTNATLLLGAGVNPKVVAERLGHSSVTLTLDTYSHVLSELDEQTAEVLEGVLQRPQLVRTGT